jgi:predicted acylesterase/phospholipase RssA
MNRWRRGNIGRARWQRYWFGQPGFFTPRPPQDWFSSDKLVSYYQTSALKGTLERLVDFDRINDVGDMRLSVGAVNVRTGRFAYFDSEEITIRPEHIMASGALPPGFPPVEIDGAVLGRRTLFKHAAGIHGGLLSASQSRDLSGGRVPGAWPPTGQS